jgi:ferric-dicitrate binding protein FerR (iron transport regulator)
MSADYSRELKIAEIIARRSVAAPDDAERELLDRWLGESPANAELYEKIARDPSAKDRERIMSMFDAKRFADATMRRIGRRRRRVAVAGAAAAAAVLLLGVVVYRSLPVAEPRGAETVVADRTRAVLSLPDGSIVELGDEKEQETAWVRYAEAHGAAPDAGVDIRIAVPRAGEYKLRLDDGTVVWLNSESALEYPRSFGGGRRVVKLSGEGYFEVERDEARPFVVIAGDAEITVLGTSFNVDASRDVVTTTLVSGSVEMATTRGTVTLAPGDQAVAGEAGIAVRQVDATLWSSWTQGVFKFDKMPLAEICARLSKWYDVDFTFEGDSGSERFTGGTWKYVPLEDFLESIGQITNVSFRHDGGTVVVSPKK